MPDFTKMTDEQKQAYNKATKLWEKNNGRTRIEVLNQPLLNIDKLLIQFQSYDRNTNKQNGFIPMYLDPAKFLAFCIRVCNGEILRKAQQIKKIKASNQNVYVDPLFKEMGGMTPEVVAAKKAKNPQDLAGYNLTIGAGQGISRTLEVTTGDLSTFLISVIATPGTKDRNGLIVPVRGANVTKYTIGLSAEDLTSLCGITKVVLETYYANKNYYNALAYLQN